ncbi:NACHT domain-containing protein [Streptomyces hokutonensis]|uniref:NACHT domain-containing protein n=1 Tax=Streptomyces hokutonensis TaxID=1306990 RepID=A0ABW6MHQ6_9ACTN
MVPEDRDADVLKFDAMGRLKDLAAIVPLCAAILAIVRYVMGDLSWGVYVAIVATLALVVSIVHRVRRNRRNARLVRQLTSELQEILQGYAKKQPAGYLSNDHITMADLIFDSDDSLYVNPEFESNGLQVGSSAVDLICHSLQERCSVAVLGDPGIGKSLVLLKAYSRLLRRFAEGPADNLLPVLIRMHSLPRMPERDEVSNDRGPHVQLASLLRKALSLPGSVQPALERLICENRVVLLLDGADEMRMEAARSAHFDDIGSFFELLFTLPAALSSRTEFYDVNVAPSKIGEYFSREVKLKEWSFPFSGERLVLGICAKSGSADGQLISSTIVGSSYLMDLARKPLTIFMMADALPLQLTGDAFIPDGNQWRLADLYEEYCRRWLQVESRKGGRVAPETKRQLMQIAAWKIFTQSGIHGAQMGRYQLQDLLLRNADLQEVAEFTAAGLGSGESPELNAKAFVREMQSRSFLVPADIPAHYRFVHKSFFEYFTARYIWSALRQEETHVAQLKLLLSPVIPDEINSFLRSLLQRDCHRERFRRINEAKLLRAYTECPGMDDRDVMIRQQAMNLLPIVWARRNVSQLISILASDPSPLVRRGGAVRLALEGIAMEPLDSFVREMRDSSSDAWKVHLGYNRIYYGDQVHRVNGWLDDGTPECDGIFLASLSQLQRDSHREVWSMALTTIHLLLRDPQRSAGDLLRGSDQIAATVRDIGNRVRPEAGYVYEEERRGLAELVRGLGF